MAHPLRDVMDAADGFLLIGESGKDRFPGFSFHAYTVTKKRFFCLDLDGMTRSRGPTTGERVYTSVDELPEDRGDLAIIWVTPPTCVRAVEVAHEAGCKRVWFSFGTASRAGVERAHELGLQILEIGRCPVYYLKGAPTICALHTAMTKVSGTHRRAPVVQIHDKRPKELW